MESAQDKEFATFGIVNNKLKAGLILGLLSLSLTANIYQVRENATNTKDLYEKMLDRADAAARDEANKTLKIPIEKIYQVTTKADTVLDETRSAAKTAKDAGDSILNLNKTNR